MWIFFRNFAAEIELKGEKVKIERSEGELKIED